MATIQLRVTNDAKQTTTSTATISDADLTRIVDTFTSLSGLALQATLDDRLKQLMNIAINVTKNREKSQTPSTDIPLA